MNFDITNIPFSYKGSYIAVSCFSKNFRYQQNPQGVFFRSIHGDSKNGYMGRFVPVLDKKELEYKLIAKPEELVFSTNYGELCLCFADSKTLLIKSESESLGLKIDNITGLYKYHYAHDFKGESLMNCYSLSTKYVLAVINGEKEILQTWNRVTADDCEIYLKPKGNLLCYIQEAEDESCFVKENYNYNDCKNRAKAEFEKYYNAMPNVPKEYEEQRELAAYVNWSSIVEKSGLFKRDAMLMSKNWMTNVWSWDHCFNALALCPNMPKQAFDQFMVMFDHQNKQGRIPDHLNDKLCTSNFCKPPIHGFTIIEMLERQKFSFEQLTEVYEKLSKWTYWWLNYRLSENGVCEYYHGNDSGWDNSTVFKQLPPVQSPDLTSFLVVQAQALCKLADKLNKNYEAKQWQKTADEILGNMLSYLFENDQPCAKLSCDNKIVENDSLLLCMPIILGKDLPEKYRNNIINMLKSEKFLTNYGLATQSPQSEDYLSDGYWQGPIWAPSTMLIIEGLYKCGENDFAKELSIKFCELVKKGGFAENFDAVSGQGLRDRAYTWTSSAFLCIANKLL